MRTTEEDLEEASEGDRQDWFEKEGCPKLSKVETECKQLQKNGGMQPSLLRGQH